MRLPRSNRKNENHASGKQAHEALVNATETLDAIKARSPEVRNTARALRVIRENNHFAEQLAIIMGGSCE